MRLGVKRGKLDNVPARRVELDSLIDVQDADFVARTRADRNTGSLRPGRRWGIHVLITSDSCDARGISSEVSATRFRPSAATSRSVPPVLPPVARCAA